LVVEAGTFPGQPRLFGFENVQLLAEIAEAGFVHEAVIGIRTVNLI
jgi:hypothetical protein